MFYVEITVKDSLPGIGKGVFAEQFIPAGQKVCSLDGPFISWAQAKALGRENHVIPISSRQYADMPLENTLNHSCDANLGFAGNTTLIARRDIQPGEEITWDYSLVTADGWSMDCLCRLPACRGLVTNYADLPDRVKEQYQAVTPPWIRQAQPFTP